MQRWIAALFLFGVLLLGSVPTRGAEHLVAPGSLVQSGPDTDHSPGSGARTLLPVVRRASSGAARTPTQAITPESVRARLAGLRLVSYYPANSRSTYMWSNWDPGQIDRDFGQIAALRANAVRVILYPRAFGYPAPSRTMLDRLAQMIALADKHGLRVELTLFGWWADYHDAAGSRQWLNAVLAPYHDDPRVALVELQNELDTANANALAWAAATIPYARTATGSIPVTISVSGAVGAAGLERIRDAKMPVDYYDLHYYGAAPLAYHNFQRALRVADTVPLFVGESGYSTLPATARADQRRLTPAWQEAFQDQYHRTVQYAARASGLPVVAPWIFSDFAPGAIPPISAAASIPAEYHYGFKRVDGSRKPAAASLATVFGGGRIDPSFNNGFEQHDGEGLPTNWLLWQPSVATFARDTTVARSGAAAARISRSSATSAGVPAFYASPVEPTLPGDTYTASVWARGQQASGVTNLRLAWFDAAGRWLGNSTSPDLRSGTTTWTQLTVSASAPSAAAFVEIHLVSANNSGTVWFDDVSFQ